MTNDERDEMIKDTHDAVIVMVGKVESHQTDLYGNGKAGIKVDVDRLKVFKRAECWIGGIIIVTLVGLLGKFMYSHLTG